MKLEAGPALEAGPVPPRPWRARTRPQGRIATGEDRQRSANYPDGRWKPVGFLRGEFHRLPQAGRRRTTVHDGQYAGRRDLPGHLQRRCVETHCALNSATLAPYRLAHSKGIRRPPWSDCALPWVGWRRHMERSMSGNLCSVQRIDNPRRAPNRAATARERFVDGPPKARFPRRIVTSTLNLYKPLPRGRGSVWRAVRLRPNLTPRAQLR
jgi:hypothetical protein